MLTNNWSAMEPFSRMKMHFQIIWMTTKENQSHTLKGIHELKFGSGWAEYVDNGK